MDVDWDAHHEARGEAFIYGGDLGGETVAADDDLLIFLVKFVEGVEEFILAFFFADDELEVVNNEDVEFAVFVGEAVEFLAHGFYEVVIKLLNGDVEDFHVWVLFDQFVADGLDEMGFAKSRATIDEIWVIAFTGVLYDGVGGADGKIVIATYYIVIEAVFGVEAVVASD